MRGVFLIAAVLAAGVLTIEGYRWLSGRDEVVRPHEAVHSVQRVVCQTLLCAEVAAVIAPDPAGPVIAWPEVSREPRYSLVAADAAHRVVTPSHAEAIAALRPDLVVVAPYTRSDTLAQLETLGFRLLRQADPKGFDEIRTSVRALGEALGRPAEAEALVQAMDAKLARVRAAVAGKPPLRVVAWFSGIVPGRETTLDAAISAAGLINAAAPDHGNWAPVDQERLVAMRPDVLILAADQDGDPPVGLDESPALLAWHRAGGRVVTLRGALLGTVSHRLADAVVAIAERVHGVDLRAAPAVGSP